MTGAANNAIIRLGRSPFAASRSEAVLLAALSRVGVAKEAGAKQPRWQARKSTASADQATTNEERARRKGRLIKGPQEFREIRADWRKPSPDGGLFFVCNK